jgi:hypothetical protein
VFSGGIIFVVLVLGGPFIYATFKAIQWQWWISGVRFGGVSFTSMLRARDLMGLYWKVVGWLLLITVGLFIAIFGVILSAILLTDLPGTWEQKTAAVMQQWHVVVPMFVCYILAALMVTAVMRIYLIHDLSARVAASTTVHNIAAAETVVAGGPAASAIGEGLADSLEMFGF